MRPDPVGPAGSEGWRPTVRLVALGGCLLAGRSVAHPLDPADDALRRGDWPTAERVAVAVDADSELHVAARTVLVRAYAAQGRYRAAVHAARDVLISAAASEAERDWALREIAEVYVAIDRPDDALAYLDQYPLGSDGWLDATLRRDALTFGLGSEPHRRISDARMLEAAGRGQRWFEPALHLWTAEAYASLCWFEDAAAEVDLARARIARAEQALDGAAELPDAAIRAAWADPAWPLPALRAQWRRDPIFARATERPDPAVPVIREALRAAAGQVAAARALEAALDLPWVDPPRGVQASTPYRLPYRFKRDREAWWTPWEDEEGPWAFQGASRCPAPATGG